MYFVQENKLYGYVYVDYVGVTQEILFEQPDW